MEGLIFSAFCNDSHYSECVGKNHSLYFFSPSIGPKYPVVRLLL